MKSEAAQAAKAASFLSFTKRTFVILGFSQDLAEKWLKTLNFSEKEGRLH
jgi:hypothetical protein